MEQRIVNRRYRIDRLLGEGGMAEVYLGHDILLHRPVAIKTLRPQFARDAGFRARFEREAQAAASFSHPNIIDIYDVGEDNSTPYIVMEYVPGDNLARIIDTEGPFDPDDVAVLIEQVASALDYAHERGFVHRDVKPHNILVDDAGLARVVDFGIAKGLADSDLTATGTGLGTVHYVSPEQASGLMATPSSDIYSLAVVAFEMLTGRLPFDADTPVGIAMKHVNDAPPSPAGLNPNIPRPVAEIILRALAKDPTVRFNNAGAFANALTNWRSAAATHAIPSAAAPTTVAPLPATAPTQARSTTPASIPPAAGAAPPMHPPYQGQSTAVPGAEPQRTGCAGWLVAISVIVALGALIWFGFQLAPRIPGTGGDDDPTRPPASTNATNTPEDESDEETETEPTSPAIIPRETEEAADFTVVPDLEGMTVNEAEDAAADVGLTVEQVGAEGSDDVEEGRILRQEPQADAEAARNSSIAVVVSSGSTQIDIAELDLNQLTADEAEELLRDQGLDVLRQDQGNPDVPEGMVIGVEPADVASQGSTVTLFISVGDKVQIPQEIQGAPLDQAQATLAELGFSVTESIPVSRQVIEDFDIDLEDAEIEDQDVVGIQDNDANFGAWLPPGTSVRLVYYDQAQDENQP
ncbi:MAG: Stk1 family PASTA domain-containing Ser/Thr kinase [Thermomicrobiales bacterium]